MFLFELTAEQSSIILKPFQSHLSLLMSVHIQSLALSDVIENKDVSLGIAQRRCAQTTNLIFI